MIFEHLINHLAPQAQLVSTRQLTGGSTAHVTLLELLHADGALQKLVVRHFDTLNHGRDPQRAATEYLLLKTLYQAGVAVPQPYAYDAGRLFGMPWIVLEYVNGTPYGEAVAGPSVLSQAAQHLALIHQLDGAGFSWLPQRLEPEQARGGQEYVDRLWQVVQAYRPLTQPNKLCVLHGDFWPGNLLWRDQQLVAIIDWEDSWLGDPLADLARSRLEILWAWGEAAMDNFTDYYQQAMPNIEYAALPYWECYAALELAAFATWTHDQVVLQQMHTAWNWFVQKGLSRL